MANIDARVLRHRVQNISTLPTIPDVVKRLSVIIENPSISLNEITQFVSNDPALATKILKMVNSAIYGFPGRISSVSHAIMLIGVNVVKGLLLGISVFEVMQKAMVGLREHSVACAVAARVLATKKGMKEPEEISVAGLIHDIGKVILTLEFPDEYQCALDLAEKKRLPSLRLKGSLSQKPMPMSGRGLPKNGVFRATWSKSLRIIIIRNCQKMLSWKRPSSMLPMFSSGVRGSVLLVIPLFPQ